MPTIGLFIPCYVDQLFPRVGLATLDLLERCGQTVEFPTAQTCCGQPAYNSGDKADAREIAKQTITAFEGFDYVVAPSGSCAGMLIKHYPLLFAGDPVWEPRAKAFSAKVHELVSFLHDVRGFKPAAQFSGTVTYHDSCSGLRELGIKEQPRALLSNVDGLHLQEMPDADVCCGFGGTFCVKYSDISNAIVSKKTENIETSGADLLLAGDLGCLMNMAGKLKRQGSKTEVRHVAEVLAGQLELPPIGGKG